MSIQDYLHEKAEESRHNETRAHMMLLAGAVFFVGGIISSLSLSQEPSWFLFIPYHATLAQAMFLELSFIIFGLSLIVVGMGVGVHHYRDRRWYLRELRKANDIEDLGREQNNSPNHC